MNENSFVRFIAAICVTGMSLLAGYHLVWSADWQCHRWQESCDRRNYLRSLRSALPGNTSTIIPIDVAGSNQRVGRSRDVFNYYQRSGWTAEKIIWRVPISIGIGFAIWLILYFSLRGRLSPGTVRASIDVIEDEKKLRKLSKPFELEPHIDLRKGILIGRDEKKKLIYLPHSTFTKNHVDILGISGTGKSSTVGVLLSQMIIRGESVIVFDPKNDAMLPGVLARMAAQAKRPVLIIDLRMSAPPQLNPLAGASSAEIEELLQVALELGKSGDPKVDFHRGEDRARAEILAGSIDGTTSFPELLAEATQNEEIQAAANFARELRQLCRIPAFQTEHDVNLAGRIAAGGLIYIIGSTTDTKVHAAQRLLLQRMLQLIDQRSDKRRPVCMFLDELKYLLSPAALRAAGTIRDRNCHLIFAHQSIGDLSDCPGLSPKAVEGAIWGNTGIKLVYKVDDKRTMEELELLGGEVRAYSENLDKARSLDKAGGGWREGNRPRFPAHIFNHLPKPENGEASVGILFGQGPAFVFSTRWLRAGPTPQPMPAKPYQPADGRAVPTSANDLI